MLRRHQGKLLEVVEGIFSDEKIHILHDANKVQGISTCSIET